MEFFKGRRLVIATKHHKEKVIAPLLESALGVKCVVAENVDTDILGTFTGEVERMDDPLTTARKKCLMVMELMDCDLAVASEGSFGPHPQLAFVPADDEFLILLDKKNNLEIAVREISTATNFNGEEIKTEKQLNEFAKRANFPSHGLIVRKSAKEKVHMVKGITDNKLLHSTFQDYINQFGKAYVETDMRALYNPSRMKVIEAATQKLSEKIKSCCPQCQTPGFGITGASDGLPCSLCGSPTRSLLSYTFSCSKCNYSQVEMYPNKKMAEDPMYCDFCNP